MDIEKYLNDKYEFKYNEILNRTYYKNRGSDSDFKLLRTYKFNSIFRELKNNGISVSAQTLKCLLESDFVKKFDPFKDYFNSLPRWDGQTDYLKQLASTIKTTNDALFQWAFKKWLVALVSCAIDRESSNHSILILTGKQGTGKTTWLLNLVPKILKEYAYSGNIKPGNKDTTILLSEKLLINMDELASYNKSQVESFKELITKNVISERRAYGYFNENYIRRASFVGSSNHNEILMDVSGNRRFLVFETLNIDYKHNVDLDKVYGQAKALLDEGFEHFFNRDDIKLIEENNEQFRQTSLEEEYVEKYFEIPSEDDQFQLVYMNASEIIEFIKERTKTYLNIGAVSLGKLMKSKGYTTAKIRGINKYKLKMKDQLG